MTLEHLALFCLGVWVVYLIDGDILRLFGGRFIDEDEETYDKEQSSGVHYESTEFIGYVAVSIGVLLYISYRIFQAG